jgi:SAM-dependent methyltransferase
VNTAISESCPLAASGHKIALGVSEPGPCPACGASGAPMWLQAPDRFHGRRQLYKLVRCPGCSLVWLVNPPAPREMHSHYTGAYDRLIAESGEKSAARWDFRVKAVEQIKTSGALLDLGCSSGAFLSLLDRRKWSLYGIEMSEESAKAAGANSGAEVFVGEILDAKYPPESLDVITCFDVLEHLYEPRLVLARVAEWLKPGGIFYVLIPNIDSVEARIFKSYWHGLELPRHLFHYSPASLRFLAESAGLKTVSLQTRRNAALGTSLRYVGDDLLRRFGIERTPVAYRDQPCLAWRAARKIVRMTILRLLLAAAPLAGSGESIHAIFRKDPIGMK